MSDSPTCSTPPLRSAIKVSSRPATPISSTSVPPHEPPIVHRLSLPATSRSPPTRPPPRPSVSSSPLPASTSFPSTNATTQVVSPSPSIQGYTSKVSFDTFENPAASMFSFTLGVKSDGYVRTRSTRIFLCAASPDESGREALDWALEALVQDGDELIVCRGVDQEELDKDHDILREEARELMRQIQEKSATCDSERKLSLILEYIPGRITDTLDRLIALYRPDSVVVGTRGRRTWQTMGVGFGMGSVSKHCLTHSPVPIIVVRPERKVRKNMEKRRADPKRGRHFEE